jgi:hypothetical protein
LKIASGQNLGSKKYFDFGLKTVVLPLFSTRDFIGDMGFAWNAMKEKQVTQAAVTYAYHAYLETLLNYKRELRTRIFLKLFQKLTFCSSLKHGVTRI